jgi:hypothetical protein
LLFDDGVIEGNNIFSLFVTEKTIAVTKLVKNSVFVHIVSGITTAICDFD